MPILLQKSAAADGPVGQGNLPPKRRDGNFGDQPVELGPRYLNLHFGVDLIDLKLTPEFGETCLGRRQVGQEFFRVLEKASAEGPFSSPQFDN